MMRKKKPVKPTPYYIKYDTYKINDFEYKFEITYFIYSGSVFTNIDVKRTKTIICPAHKFKDMELQIHNRTIKTYNLLITELRKIGANKTAAMSVIKEKMR